MTPFRLAGTVLLVLGIVIVAMRGLSYTRDRQSVEIGNVELTAERKGVVPPVVGVLAIVAGAALLLIPARRS